MTAREAWLPVVGYEGIYSVSDQGRIRRELTMTCTTAGRILVTPDRGNGYLCVGLWRGGKVKIESVHRVVAAAFIGPSGANQEVNHINGEKADNRLTNLEYVSRSQNQVHCSKTGLRVSSGERNNYSKLDASAVIQIRNSSRDQAPTLAQKYGVHPGTIRRIMRGVGWQGIA